MAHCYYTVGHSKTIECGRMTMAPHSSHVICALRRFQRNRSCRAATKGRKTFGFPTNVCPSRRRVTTATGKSTGSLKGDRPRWRSHRCERSKISNLHRHEVPWFITHYQRRWRSHRSPKPRTPDEVPCACEESLIPNQFKLQRQLNKSHWKLSDWQFDEFRIGCRNSCSRR